MFGRTADGLKLLQITCLFLILYLNVVGNEVMCVLVKIGIIPITRPGQSFMLIQFNHHNNSNTLNPSLLKILTNPTLIPATDKLHHEAMPSSDIHSLNTTLHPEINWHCITKLSVSKLFKS